MACTLSERFDYLKEKLKSIGEDVSGSDLARIKDVLKRSMMQVQNDRNVDTFKSILKAENEYRAAQELDPNQTDVPQLAHAVKVELSRLRALVANDDDGQYSKDILSILSAMKSKTLAEIDRGESEIVHIFNRSKSDAAKITSDKETKTTRILNNMALIAKGKTGYPDGFNMNDDLLVLEDKKASDYKKALADSRIMKRNTLLAQHAAALKNIGYSKAIPSYLSGAISSAEKKLRDRGMYETMLADDVVTKEVVDKLDISDLSLRKRLMAKVKKVRDIVKKYLDKKKKILLRIDKKKDDVAKVDELIEKVESRDALTIDDMNVLGNIYSKSDKKTNVKNKYSSNLDAALEHTGITKIMTTSGSPLQKLRALISNPFGINTMDLEQLSSEILNERSADNFTEKDAVNVKTFIGKMVNAYSPGKKFTDGTRVTEDGRIETSLDNYDIGSLLATEDKTHLTYEVEESLKYAVPLAMNQIQTVKYDILKMAKDKQDVIDNFSFITNNEEVDILRTEASNGNVPISSLVKDISQVVSDMIGLKPNENLDVKDRAKYDAGIKALVYAQIAQDNSVIKVKAVEFNGNKQYFVSTNDTMLDENFSVEEISDMKDSITKLTYLVSQQKKVRPSLKPLPTPETVHNNPDIKLSDIDKDNLEKRNKTPWNFDENFKVIAKMAKHDRDSANKLFGFMDSKDIQKMNIEDQLLQVAKNEVIVRELTELLKEYDRIGLNKDFYLNFVATSPKRTTIMSNITPMDSKIVHRPFLNKKSYVVEVNGLSDAKQSIMLKRDQLLVLDGSVTKEESFEVAISEAFGIGVDKMSRYGIFKEIRGIVDIYGTSGVVVKSKEYSDLKDFIEDSSDPMDLSLLIPFTEKFGSHAMAAAIELKKLHIAKQNQTAFSHSLTIEADAISSGPSLLAQMVGWSEQTRAILSKTGIMNKEDYAKYEKYTRDILAEHYGISEKNKDKIVFNMPSLIEAGKIHSKMTSEQKKKYGEVYADLYTHIGTTAAGEIDMLNIEEFKDMKEKDKPLFDSLAFLIRHSTKLFIENIRNIAKPPVMTNAYGASLGSIKRELSENNIESIFIQSIRGELDEPVKHQFARNILVSATRNAKPEDGQRLLDEHMKDTNNFKSIEEIEDIEQEDGYYPAKNYMLTNKDIKDKLKIISDKTLGSAFERSMTENMGEIENYRDAMKTLDVVHVEMVKAIMDNLVSKARAENNGKLTKESFTEIIQKMNELGYGYTLDMFEAQQAFYKQSEASSNSRTGHGYAKISGPNSELFNGKTTQNAQEKEYVSNMGAYPTTSIHMIDGELMRKALENNDFTSIYDAILFPSDLNVLDKTTHEYNQYAPELLAKNNALDITYEKMDKMAKFLSENQELRDSVVEKFNFITTIKKDEVVKHKNVVAKNTYANSMLSKEIGKDEWINNLATDRARKKGVVVTHRDVNGTKQIKVYDGTKTQVAQITIKDNGDGTSFIVSEAAPGVKGAAALKGSTFKASFAIETNKVDKDIASLNSGSIGGYLNLSKTFDPSKNTDIKYATTKDGFTELSDINESESSALDESSNLYSDLQRNRAKMFTGTNWVDKLYGTINTVAKNREKLLEQGTLSINHMAVGMTTFAKVDMKDIEAYPNMLRTSDDHLGSLFEDIDENIKIAVDKKIEMLFSEAYAEIDADNTKEYDDINNIYNEVNNMPTDHNFSDATTKIGKKLLKDIDAIGGISYGDLTAKEVAEDKDVAFMLKDNKYLNVVNSYLNDKEKC